MEHEEDSRCPECGAPVHGASCEANFHALLALEWEIPGGPSEEGHFYAVASYGLQHPTSMGFSVETVEGLRGSVVDMLEGAASLEDVRRRVRAEAGRAGRVSRREGDAVPCWQVDHWPIVVTDVLAAGTEGGTEGYRDRVAAWAGSIVEVTRGGCEPAR